MTTATRPQHLVALSDANEVRLAASAWRHDVEEMPRSEGFAFLAETLEAPLIERKVGSLTLLRFLTAVCRQGPRFAEKLAARAGVLRDVEVVRIRDLNLRERSVLVAELRRCAGLEES